MFVVFKPTANSTYAAVFGITSGNLAAVGRPNVFSLVQAGTSERSTAAFDFDGANFAFGMTAASNVSINLNTIRLDEIVVTNSSSTTKIFTNGVENTYGTAPGSYTSSYSNYPVAYTSIAANSTAWGSRTFTGNVYEVAIYNRDVTSSERTGLENYFYLKWVFKPTSITSNVYWFDAADTSTITTSGTTVTAWANKGTGTLTFYSNTGTVSSETSSKNGKNVISFPTSSKLLSGNTYLAITGNDETVFVVYQKRANLTTGGGIVFMVQNGGVFSQYQNSIAYGTDFTSGTYYYDLIWTVSSGYCFTSVGNIPNYSPYVYQLVTLSISQTSPGLWIFGKSYGAGSGPGQYWTGGCANGYDTTAYTTIHMGDSTVDWDMAEHITYNRVLTTQERQNVEGYLSIKWGIPLDPSHPYAT